MKVEPLEAVRGFAAVYVFFHHLNPLAGTPFEMVFRFGQEAVLLFFLVSGFVISYSQFGVPSPKPLSVFLYRRAIRIYPIFVISIVLAGFVAFISGASECIDVKVLIGNFLMLQDIEYLKSGTWVQPFCSNSPLWYLSYEWWFYVTFAIIFSFKNISINYRRACVVGISIAGTLLFLIYPAQPFLFASYFSLWWAGLELALEFISRKKLTFYGQKFSIFLLITCAGVWAIPVAQALWHQKNLSLGIEPVLQLRHFLAGIVFLFLVLASSRMNFAPMGIVRLFGFLAPISYGLYASHQPVITLVRQLNFGPHLTLVITVVLAFFVAYLLEVVFQPRIAKWFLSPKSAMIPGEIAK